jgi:hypothetical protein
MSAFPFAVIATFIWVDKIRIAYHIIVEIKSIGSDSLAKTYGKQNCVLLHQWKYWLLLKILEVLK